MKKNLPGGRFRLIFAAIAACLVIGIVLTFSSILDQSTIAGPKGETGTQEKMIVASANIALDVDVNRLNGINSRPKTSSLRFTAVPDTFFTVLVFNNELRGPLPSSLELRPVDAPALPAGLTAAYRQLVIESLPWGGTYTGPAGFKEMIGKFLSNFDEVHPQPQRFLEADDGHVLVTVSGTGTTKSGNELGGDSIWLYRVDDGKIEHAEFYGDTATAVEALA